MDDVSLKQKQTDDQELDKLIFDGEKEKHEAVVAGQEHPPQTTHDSDSDSSDDADKNNATKATVPVKAVDRSSLNNVLPVDKLKNGATTASK